MLSANCAVLLRLQRISYQLQSESKTSDKRLVLLRHAENDTNMYVRLGGCLVPLKAMEFQVYIRKCSHFNELLWICNHKNTSFQQ